MRSTRAGCRARVEAASEYLQTVNAQTLRNSPTKRVKSASERLFVCWRGAKTPIASANLSSLVSVNSVNLSDKEAALTADIVALITAYFLCSETAAVRRMETSEVDICAAMYQSLKLSFLPGVGDADFNGLSASERSAVNRQAYAAYVAWRAANPRLVAEMEEDARDTVEASGRALLVFPERDI